ncbi:hypothetical protein [Kushneria indalinina]|uniref:Uncharacterized protein n=1 Tax=Kushneria indalinina DSM 14324 TaxID=1122140 RepID=A0A3D9E2D6_9GAMM|nr:hypothetical protein [Kushneria indalinina]REC96669.1 hypothetical protein C8D72_0001 [Kushneria indalinina DSM 14324]
MKAITLVIPIILLASTGIANAMQSVDAASIAESVTSAGQRTEMQPQAADMGSLPPFPTAKYIAEKSSRYDPSVQCLKAVEKNGTAFLQERSSGNWVTQNPMRIDGQIVQCDGQGHYQLGQYQLSSGEAAMLFEWWRNQL